MKAAEWIARDSLRVVDLPEPRAADGQAVIEVAACGICGSDLHSYRDGFAVGPGQVLGHEFSGTIVEAPGVEGLAVGTRVVARPLIPCCRCPGCRAGEPQRCSDRSALNIGYRSPGAFAERVLVPRAVVGETIFPLPAEVSDQAGALVEPFAVALHAVNGASVREDDSALVLGGGPIGLGVARLLRLRGVRHLTVVELSSLRRERALAAGADLVIDPASEDVATTIREVAGSLGGEHGANVDLVIDCAGAEAALRDALRVLRRGGTLVLTAIFGKSVAVHLDQIVEKEIVAKGSFAYRDEFVEVVELLAGGMIDPDLFVSHAFGLDEIIDAFEVQSDPRRSTKVMVLP